MPSQNYDRGKKSRGICVYDFNNVGQVVQSLVGSSLMISTNRHMSSVVMVTKPGYDFVLIMFRTS